MISRQRNVQIAMIRAPVDMNDINKYSLQHRAMHMHDGTTINCRYVMQYTVKHTLNSNKSEQT